jgi:hypothetical protein
MKVFLTILFMIGSILGIGGAFILFCYIACKLHDLWQEYDSKYKVLKVIGKILSIIGNGFLWLIAVLFVIGTLYGFFQSSYQLLWSK